MFTLSYSLYANGFDFGDIGYFYFYFYFSYCCFRCGYLYSFSRWSYTYSTCFYCFYYSFSPLAYYLLLIYNCISSIGVSDVPLLLLMRNPKLSSPQSKYFSTIPSSIIICSRIHFESLSTYSL